MWRLKQVVPKFRAMATTAPKMPARPRGRSVSADAKPVARPSNQRVPKTPRRGAKSDAASGSITDAITAVEAALSEFCAAQQAALEAQRAELAEARIAQDEALKDARLEVRRGLRASRKALVALQADNDRLALEAERLRVELALALAPPPTPSGYPSALTTALQTSGELLVVDIALGKRLVARAPEIEVISRL